MSVIHDLNFILSSTEKAGFVRHLGQLNKRKDVRNLDLFRAIQTGKEERIRQQIGGNAFRVLSKRLTDRLLEYVAGNVMEAEATLEMTITKYLLTARRLLTYEKFKSAFKLLERAEKMAISIDHHALLNDIYHTQIQYSFRPEAPEQQALFEQFELNGQRFIGEERLNMVYAYVRKAFQDDDPALKEKGVAHLLEESYARFGIASTDRYSYKTLYQLAHIADISGAQTRNYHAVDDFFSEQLELLKGSATDNEQNLDYQIEVLHLVANIYFRKKDFANSRAHLEAMHVQMQRYNGKYAAKWALPHTLLTALNLNFTGRAGEAIQLLETGLLGQDETQALKAQLALVMFYFQQGALESARKLLAKLYHTDNWYERQVGKEWVLQKRYIEILLHIELGNIDFVDACMTSFTRKYGRYFKAHADRNVLPFLKLVKQYYQSPQVAETTAYRQRVKQSIDWIQPEEEDLFLMCFFAWLKAKMEQKELYNVTLELVQAVN